jgi:pimeloyl-ACP methyl ester carboxylesterase
MRCKIERTHFVGLSMGGMIGQHLALKAPQRIERLVIWPTPPAACRRRRRPLWAERIRIAWSNRAWRPWCSRRSNAGSPRPGVRRIRR